MRHGTRTKMEIVLDQRAPKAFLEADPAQHALALAGRCDGFPECVVHHEEIRVSLKLRAIQAFSNVALFAQIHGTPRMLNLHDGATRALIAQAPVAHHALTAPLGKPAALVVPDTALARRTGLHGWGNTEE